MNAFNFRTLAPNLNKNFLNDIFRDSIVPDYFSGKIIQTGEIDGKEGFKSLLIASLHQIKKFVSFPEFLFIICSWHKWIGPKYPSSEGWTTFDQRYYFSMYFAIEDNHFNQVRTEGIGEILIGWDFPGYKDIGCLSLCDGPITVSDSHQEG